MNAQHHSRTGLVLATAIAAAAAVAQQSGGDRPPQQRTADTTLGEWLVDKDARVSELIGRRVVNPAGTDLGEVEDLLATPGREQQPVVVLSIGGVLDVGDKWYSASLDQLQIAPDGKRLLLDKTEAELEAAPDFDYVPTVGEESPLPGVRGPQTTSSVGSLLGATVVDGSGESIGEIDDLVVSTGTEGTRAVVDLDDDVAAGAGGDRRVAVPFDELTIELTGEEARAVPLQARVRIDLEQAGIEALPAYEYPAEDPI